jgi:hypothetical protein
VAALCDVLLSLPSCPLCPIMLVPCFVLLPCCVATVLCFVLGLSLCSVVVSLVVLCVLSYNLT